MTENSSLTYVASVDELADAGRVIVEVDGREIAVFDRDGAYFAVSNYCVHQGGPVCEGLVTGRLTVDGLYELMFVDDEEVVVCPWHGWEFDITTGDHLSGTGLSVPTYDVVVQGDGVYLDL